MGAWDDFTKKLPFKLVPLAVDGAFVAEAPPGDLDLARASSAELVERGFLVRRPQPESPAAAVWQRLSSRKWLARDRIVPQLSVQKGKTHLRGRRSDSAPFNDSAWAGCSLTADGGGPVLAATNPLDGYQTPDGQQHVNVIGPDQHVHELVYADQWHHNDLTARAGAPSAAPNSAVDGYATPWNGQQHVHFIGDDGHVHELVYLDGSWRHNDLTAVAGAPSALSGSALDGFATTFNDQQHVHFMTADGHVHELIYNGQWHHSDLSAITGAPPAAAGSPLDGYQTVFNSQQHINFLGADQHVHELIYNGQWHHNDLTVNAGAPPAAAGSGLDGYATEYNRQQHVNFIGADGHVHELMYDGSWQHRDLSASAGAPPAVAGRGLDGYDTTFNNQQHVNFVGTDGHVHELVYLDGSWRHNDLSAAAAASDGPDWRPAPPVAIGGALAGFQTLGRQHVNFIGTDNRLHQLTYNGKAWSHDWFPEVATVPWVTAFGVWTIPTVTMPNTGQGTQGGWSSASWVGIDGFLTTNDVLQAGIDQDVDSDGNAGYVAWFEWYAPDESGSPGYRDSTNIDNFPVAPGQSVACLAQYVDGNSAGQLIFINETTGQHFSIILRPPPGAAFDGQSIEWIMEAYNGGEPTTSPPRFTPVIFTSALGCNAAGAIGNPAAGLLENIARNGTALTSVSASDWRVEIDFIEWVDVDLTALAKGAAPMGRALAGNPNFVTAEERFYFVAADGHLHMIVVDAGQCRDDDLTVLTGAPTPAADSALDAYETSYNGQQHVNFVADDRHVHELMWDGQWHHNDLSALAGAPPVAPGSALDGYMSQTYAQQHINFLGADGHVHELVYDGSWRHADLTAVAGAPPAAAGSALDGYMTPANGQQHINFLGAGNHVHELIYDGQWHHNDLTGVVGAPLAAAGSALDGYVSASNQQHVNFIGADGHVHELMYDGHWHHNDLTAIAGAPPAVAGSGISGYQSLSPTVRQHVDFVTADGHVHELVYDQRGGGWQHNDLSAITGAAGAGAGSRLIGFQQAPSRQHQVLYLAADSHLHSLLYRRVQ